eukprot:1159071-Pelagomonas_calceolata.AAC.7
MAILSCQVGGASKIASAELSLLRRWACGEYVVSARQLKKGIKVNAIPCTCAKEKDPCAWHHGKWFDWMAVIAPLAPFLRLSNSI